jgi:hypothetical protein
MTSARFKQEIGQFFVSASFFTGRDAHVAGWHGSKAAMKLNKSTSGGG